MVDTSVTKYHLVPPDLTTNLSLFTTRKKSTFLLFTLVFIFLLFTLFISFTPSSSSSSSFSSHWFLNIFTLNSTSPPVAVTDPPASRSPSLFSYFFPDDGDDHVGPTSPDLLSHAQSFDPDSHPHEVSHGPTLQDIGKDGNLGPYSHVNEVSQQPSSSNLSKYGSFEANSQVNEVFPGSGLQNLSKDGSFEQNGSKNSNGTTIDPTRSQNLSESPIPNSSSSVLDATNTTNTPLVGENGQNVAKSQTPNSSESILGSENTTSIDNAMHVAQAPVDSATGLGNSTNIENGVEEKGVKEKVIASHSGASSSRKGGNESVLEKGKKGGKEGNLIEALVDCDLYDGEWVKDESYPLYKPGSCSLIDEQFNCIRNGRPDHDFHKLKWKPKGCTLPRLSGDRMLKFLKGKRLVFVGDSLNRNMWESFVCILRNSVKNKKKVYEAFGRHSFRTEASYSFVFKDYNFTVEFFVAPFLVQQWDFKEKNGETKETLRLDLMVRDNDQFKNADFVVFNTGHWWTHDKTSKGEDYYQEGNHVHKQLEVHEAFRRAITTWARWVDANINPDKTHVLFRGYSATHFRGGQWNSGGQCDSETEPIRNDTYLTPYPWKMKVFESIINGMKTPVSYLNVTRMTDYRKDGHPSIYRKLHTTSEDEKRSPLKYQDCSHWCLPGVPDSWNELLYAELLRKQYKDRQQQKNRS